jgi:hypothetical protein
MSELKLAQGEVGGETQKAREKMNWRGILAGIGAFLLFAALFASAGSKGALGAWPMYTSLVALLLLAIAGVGGIVAHFSAKGKAS